MNPTALSAANLKAADDRRTTIVRASPAMVLRCLLVSVNQRSANVIEGAASNEGWLAERCAAVDQALRLVFRKEFHLAFVDIHSATNEPQRLEFEQLASDLAQNHIPLLVISGDPSDPLAEIHARQLGVWLYLPGFDGQTELDVVFREARAINEKLRGGGQTESRQTAGNIGVSDDAGCTNG